jgi:hypothetical protein
LRDGLNTYRDGSRQNEAPTRRAKTGKIRGICSADVHAAGSVTTSKFEGGEQADFADPTEYFDPDGTISFQEEDILVLLPKTEPILLAPDKVRERIKDREIRRSHLFPLFDATAHFGCSYLIVPQGCSPFDLPRNPWIIFVCDDLNFAWGPKAFPAESLDAAIAKADYFVLVTSSPEPFPYQAAATVAIRNRGNVLLIESLPHQQDAWRSRIEAIRGPNPPMLMCAPEPQAKQAEGAA